jgi:hypothetical protein
MVIHTKDANRGLVVQDPLPRTISGRSLTVCAGIEVTNAVAV